MLLLVCFLWAVFQVTIRVFLCARLENTLYRIESAYQSSPVQIITTVMNASTHLKTEGAFTFSYSDLGNVKCNFITKTGPNRILAEANISASEIQLPVSVYLDQEAVAITSSLLHDEYYGITFDSFAEDLQKIPMVNWVISDTTQKKWEGALLDFRANTLAYLQFLRIVPISFPDMTTIKPFLMTFPVNVAFKTLQTDQGKQKTLRMAYHISSNNVPKWIDQRFALGIEEAIEVSVICYLTEEELLLAQIAIQHEESAKRICLDLTTSDELKVSLEQEYDLFSAEFGLSEESWSWSQDGQHHDIKIQWNRETGDMLLGNSAKKEAHLKFMDEENGISIISEKFEHVLSIFDIQVPVHDLQLSLQIQQGVDFERPQFKNLDKWSFEDFLTFLDGISSLIGFQTE